MSSALSNSLTGSPPAPGRTASQQAGLCVLRPRRGLAALELSQLPRYRGLLWQLALRDVRVRYKQALLGAAWAIIQPVATMVVLSVLFGNFLRLAETTGEVPYPVFLYAGLLPWTFFAASVTAAGNSLVGNANLIRKVYFPRLIVPLAATGAPLVDLALALLVLVGMMAWYGVGLSAHLLLLPGLIGLTVLAALGVGIAMSSLTARYRDFRHVLPFLLQVWFFVTPVIYPSSVVPERWRWVLSLNPVQGPIEAFRAAALGMPFDWPALARSAAVALVCVAGGLVCFARSERNLADVV